MKQKSPPYAKRKQAFDSTIAAYRNSQMTTLAAMKYGDGGAKTTRNPAKPTVTDFRCDVEKAIKKCCRGWRISTFLKAYVLFDSEDPIEREVYAQKIMGAERHSLEQGMGALFIKRGIYPVKGKGGYFTSIRVSK